jgi:plasmid maintenance system antidote protein VapI
MKINLSDKEIADLLGVSPGFFSRMMRNQRSCSGGMARRLEELTQEDIRIWLFGDVEEKRQALQRFRSRCLNIG